MENFRQFIYDKCINFSVRMVRLAKYLQETQHESVISNQILRSGTSIGASLSEAQYGTSLKDFQSKCYICLRECAETLYWMEILVKTNFIIPEQFSSLHSDCEELKKLFVSITNTTKKKLESYSTREDSQPFIDMDTLID